MGQEKIEQIIAILDDVADGKLGRALPMLEDDTSLNGVVIQKVNAIIASWRKSELKARKAKRTLQEQLAMIEAQAAAIREMSIPVVEIWDNILLLPIVGVLDAKRSSELMDELLPMINSRSSKGVIVDVTGVELIDTKTADRLLQVARASKLVGAECVLTGLSPAVAETLVDIGADLQEIQTLQNVKDGLAHFLSRRLTKEKRAKADAIGGNQDI